MIGPFAVKMKPGRTLTAPDEQRIVPQWQKSRGSLILTAALELSGNQVTHFYSANKNTTEMIRMMELLVEQYRDRRKLYLSWDAASWHISEHVEAHDAVAAGGAEPIIETVPLPSGAQFLNVSMNPSSAGWLARSSTTVTTRHSMTRRQRSIDTLKNGTRTLGSIPEEPERSSGAMSATRRFLRSKQLQGSTLPVTVATCLGH